MDRRGHGKSTEFRGLWFARADRVMKRHAYTSRILCCSHRQVSPHLTHKTYPMAASDETESSAQLQKETTYRSASMHDTTASELTLAPPELTYDGTIFMRCNVILAATQFAFRPRRCWGVSGMKSILITCTCSQDPGFWRTSTRLDSSMPTACFKSTIARPFSATNRNSRSPG